MELREDGLARATATRPRPRPAVLLAAAAPVVVVVALLLARALQPPGTAPSPPLPTVASTTGTSTTGSSTTTMAPATPAAGAPSRAMPAGGTAATAPTRHHDPVGDVDVDVAAALLTARRWLGGTALLDPTTAPTGPARWPLDLQVVGVTTDGPARQAVVEGTALHGEAGRWRDVRPVRVAVPLDAGGAPSGTPRALPAPRTTTGAQATPPPAPTTPGPTPATSPPSPMPTPEPDR